ncbi:MAG TPA: acylphosphatase [Verrucomicrobiae bacterium]|jgi:acylphosphatase|nr:acylphosphatase [Verrucomicrobiae bacterium]
MKKQLRTLFSGTVQGVGFRYTAQNLSRRFDVTGYVRNLTDGQVEMLAEGEEDQLRQFLDAISNSHLSGFIRETRTFWDEPQGKFQTFEIAV